MSEDERRNYVQSVERCLMVIQAFTDGPRFMNFAEMAVATGLSKPTARRMLLTLQSLGYVAAEGGRFGLTAKVLGLGYAYLSSLNLPQIAQPRLEALTDELKASTAVVTLDGTDIVYVSRVHRHRISSISLAVGARLPAYVTASGRVLLAHLKPEALSDYFSATNLVAYTHATVTGEDALRAELRTVARQGWAAVDQELEIGRRSAAAPIRDAGGATLAALSFSCATTEMSLEVIVDQVVPRLVATANQISEALGAKPPSSTG
jgi:IclR family transcriptional regulator, pca regulon regulatory protein